MKENGSIAKVCLITGANSGIGKALSVGLAQQGAHVVMVCRSRQRGQAAQADVIATSKNEAVDLLIADLSSQEAIRHLATDFREKHSRLDVLVNNVGGIFSRRQLTVDGLEYTFALNHLSHFLLTNLLLDRLEMSAPARIVNLSSEAQASGQIDFTDLQGERSYSGTRAYSQSKLANVMFTVELARRLEGTGVTANAVHPGSVRTNFGRSTTTLPFSLVMRLLGPFMRSPEKGAEMLLYLATAPEVAGITGKYFVDKLAIRTNPAAYDRNAVQKLWKISQELTGMS